jgi:hypothetical protein
MAAEIERALQLIRGPRRAQLAPEREQDLCVRHRAMAILDVDAVPSMTASRL